MKRTVWTPVAPTFKAGQVLSEKLQPKYFRAVFADNMDEGDKPLDMSDAAIMAIANDAGPDNADTDTAILLALQTANNPDDDKVDDTADDADDAADETPTPSAKEQAMVNGIKPQSSVSARRAELEIAANAAKADDNAELQANLRKTGDSAAFLSMSSIYIMQNLEATYGRDGMLAMPVPGSGRIGIPGEFRVDAACNNPDWRRRKAGGNRKGDAWWQVTKVFAESLKATRDFLREQQAINDNAKLDKQQKAKLINRFSKRITAQTTKTVNAIALYHQIELAKGYEGITFAFDTEKQDVIGDDGKPVMRSDGKPQRRDVLVETAKPCIVFNDDEKTEFMYMSVEQFNGLDFAKATAKGGGYQHLIDTMSADEDETGESNIPPFKDAADAADAIAELTHWLKGRNYAEFSVWLEKEGAEQDQALLDLDAVVPVLFALKAKADARIAKLHQKAEDKADAMPSPEKTAA